jgi:hypothetical protein
MKNSVACEKKSTIFSIILRQFEKWENYKKKYLTRKPWLFYRVESKLVMISKYNKTIDKVFREKKKIIGDYLICTDFLTALSLNIFFQSK